MCISVYCYDKWDWPINKWGSLHVQPQNMMYNEKIMKTSSWWCVIGLWIMFPYWQVGPNSTFKAEGHNLYAWIVIFCQPALVFLQFSLSLVSRSRESSIDFNSFVWVWPHRHLYKLDFSPPISSHYCREQVGIKIKWR